MIGQIYNPAFQGVLCNRTFETLISPRFLESLIWQTYQLWGSSFSSQCSKFKLHLKNAAKNWDKVFSFRDNYIWIGCVKLSLLEREYLPSVLSVLGNSLDISLTCISLTETFCKTITLTVINKYGKRAVLDISTMFGRVYHVAFRMIPWNGIFLTLTESYFSESVISEIPHLWESSFFLKRLKI